MLKIFLLTKNEVELIDDWVKYHGYLFGFENIHIIDGSDMQVVHQAYEKYRSRGLNIHYSNANLNRVSEVLNECMHRHKGKNNFLIKMDTDEFLAYTNPLVVRPSTMLNDYLIRKYLEKGKSSAKYFARKWIDSRYANKPLLNKNIRSIFMDLPVTGQKYKASLTTWSFPVVNATKRPCSELTAFTPIQFTRIKSFFHSASFRHTDLGGHAGESLDNTGVIDTGLTIIHFHSTSVEDSVRRARQALISHKYIEENDNLERCKNKLLAFKQAGGKASFHKVNFYLDYISALQCGDLISPVRLNEYHPYYRPARGVRRISLVRDTLAGLEAGEWHKAQRDLESECLS